MARLSDVIESFIKQMIEEGGGEQIQIQRNELADQFRCAPSQINYVLTTRFTYDKGYLVESRRGGGGYIVIKQVSYESNEHRNRLISKTIGDSITYHKAIAIANSLLEADLITKREFEIIKISINDRTLESAEDKNKVRADILKSIVMVILS